MHIPVTFAPRDGRDHFRVEVRVVSVALPAPAHPSATAAPLPALPVEQYRDRLIGLLRRSPRRGTRLRVEQRRLEVLRLSVQ